MRTVSLLLIALVFTACHADERADTISGYAINGPLNGATVEVLGARGLLASATTDADGRFSVDIPFQPPYRLRVSGGTLDGMPYEGVLEASCETRDCNVTPWTTLVVRPMDEHGFNEGDAVALLALAVGFDYDPFTHELLTGEPVPAHAFELNVVRASLNYGAGVEDWVDDVITWLTGEDCRNPGNLGIPPERGCGGSQPDTPFDDVPPDEEAAQGPPPDEEPAHSAPTDRINWARVYQVASPDEADVRVALVGDRSMADLLVHRVSSPGMAIRDALWYITHNPEEATVRVHFGPVGTSQLKIHFVNSYGEAGWVRPHPLRGGF